MIQLRLIVPAVVAAAAAWCFTYFVTPAAVETDQQLPQTVQDSRDRADTVVVAPKVIDQHQIAEEKSAEAYRQAAEAILRRIPNAQAFASPHELPIKRPIPLPKARPIPRP